MKSASSPSSDISTKLAQVIAENTSRNLHSAILRRAYLLREAIVDPSSGEANEIVSDLAKGATIAVGGLAVTAAVAVGTFALPYLEFIATNPVLIKEYILVTFQNTQMIDIVDAIEFEYRRMRNLL